MNFGTNVPILCMKRISFYLRCYLLIHYNQQFCCEAQLFFFLSSSMRKYYHTIQDQNRFIDSIINLIVDYLKYGNGIDAEDGVFVDEDDNVSLISVKDAPDASNFHSIVNLLDLSGDVPKVNYDAVEELTNKYIFVR